MREKAGWEKNAAERDERRKARVDEQGEEGKEEHMRREWWKEVEEEEKRERGEVRERGGFKEE